ncbi:hypothetical protein, partial [Ferrovibrio terrae]|uniref:hypothetical protein n=1 Tax=Ferrovibrio terrae TaxID=2594003 RepID=UPI003137B4CC
MSPQRPRRFLTALLVTYTVLLLGIGLNLALFWRVGEMADLSDIVRRQRRDGSIYNGLMRGFGEYKYSAYRAAAPAVV